MSPRLHTHSRFRSGGSRTVAAGASGTKYGHRGWRAWLIAGGWLMLVWFALWGAVSPMLALAGALATVLTLLIFPLPVVEFDFGLHPWRAFLLISRFLWDVVLASAQVGWLAVRPGPGPRGAITTVQLRSTSDLMQTLTSLAVSLVPGSLIIDADPENRTLVIHVLDVGRGGLPAVHQQVLDQEERIVRALGGRQEIEALTGGDDDGDRAVHLGRVSLASPVLVKAPPAAEHTGPDAPSPERSSNP
ncbi:Na+/H+ antiporter subunit E [Nakamurella silvestris]|nr:Na+/H+ antiporter subunit E [Nakamurella silvestris]